MTTARNDQVILSAVELARAVASLLDACEVVEPPRDYIGASMIATPCERRMWLTHHRTPTPPIQAKANRIFRLGDKCEELIIAELRRSGMEVITEPQGIGAADVVTRQDRPQLGYTDGPTGGHIDGLVRTGLAGRHWHVLEAKSYKAERFEELVSYGVKETSFDYWAQVIVYLEHREVLARQAGLPHDAIIGALFVCINKNTSDIYIEEVLPDGETANSFFQRATRIARLKTAPDRAASRPDLLPCKYCNFAAHCHPPVTASPPKGGARKSPRNVQK